MAANAGRQIFRKAGDFEQLAQVRLGHEASLDETIEAAKKSLGSTFTWAGRFEITDDADRDHVLFKWPLDSTHA